MGLIGRIISSIIFKNGLRKQAPHCIVGLGTMGFGCLGGLWRVQLISPWPLVRSTHHQQPSKQQQQQWQQQQWQQQQATHRPHLNKPAGSNRPTPTPTPTWGAAISQPLHLTTPAGPHPPTSPAPANHNRNRHPRPLAPSHTAAPIRDSTSRR